MPQRPVGAPATLLSMLILVGLLVAAVWGWKRIPPDTQDYLVEDVIPVVLVGLVGVGLVGAGIHRLRSRRKRRAARDRVLARFEKETAYETRLDLALTAIELNDYRLEGLERVAPAMAELFIYTLKTALGDKQHRIRGMAASHLGVLRHQPAFPILLKALEDDHAYVRASAALGLGRMRASEAKAKLAEVMTEDWDQTVRSRAREALERIR